MRPPHYEIYAEGVVRTAALTALGQKEQYGLRGFHVLLQLVNVLQVINTVCGGEVSSRTSILRTCCAPNQGRSVQVAQCVLQKARDTGEHKLQLALDVCDLVLQRVHILKMRARRISGVTSDTLKQDLATRPDVAEKRMVPHLGLERQFGRLAAFLQPHELKIARASNNLVE